MTYLIVGLDRHTLTPWHQHILAHDIYTAFRIARARAAAQGVALIIAAAIGPNSSLVDAPARRAGPGVCAA